MLTLLTFLLALFCLRVNRMFDKLTFLHPCTLPLFHLHFAFVSLSLHLHFTAFTSPSLGVCSASTWPFYYLRFVIAWSIVDFAFATSCLSFAFPMSCRCFAFPSFLFRFNFTLSSLGLRFTFVSHPCHLRFTFMLPSLHHCFAFVLPLLCLCFRLLWLRFALVLP